MKNVVFSNGLRAAFLLLMLCTLISVNGYSQSASDVTGKSKVFVQLSQNETHTVLMLDLTSLPDFFERAYLLDMIFADSRMVVNDSNISGITLELIADKSFDSNELVVSLESYQEKAIAAGKSFTAEQKKELLKKYDKFR